MVRVRGSESPSGDVIGNGNIHCNVLTHIQRLGKGENDGFAKWPCSPPYRRIALGHIYRNGQP